MAGTDAAWEKWGAEDPYFGVVSTEQFRAERIDEHRDDFFLSGERTIERSLGICETHFGPLRRGAALDYGCGVGRLTLALAKRFEDVVGLDISPSMLAEARANATRLAAPNTTFFTAAELATLPARFDFVNCYIVLQHIPVKRGVPIITKLIDLVSPGGGFSIHFSVRDFTMITRSLYWLRHNVPGMNAVQNLRLGRSLSAPTMQMNEYPLPRIIGLLHQAGITEFMTASNYQGNVLTVNLVGRKPG